MKIRGLGCLWLVGVLVLLSACTRAGEGSSTNGDCLRKGVDDGQEVLEAEITGVEPEACFWCGLSEESANLYGEQEKVGVVSLNTFEIMQVRIHCYDDFGNKIEEPTGGTQVRVGHGGEGGFSAFIFENTDRGFAEGTIRLNEDVALDLAKAAEHLCDACIVRLVQLNAEQEICGVGIIDFKTGELKPFARGAGSFGLGNFYVFCDVKEGREEGLGFLVFYCPV